MTKGNKESCMSQWIKLLIKNRKSYIISQFKERSTKKILQLSLVAQNNDKKNIKPE